MTKPGITYRKPSPWSLRARRSKGVPFAVVGDPEQRHQLEMWLWITQLLLIFLICGFVSLLLLDLFGVLLPLNASWSSTFDILIRGGFLLFFVLMLTRYLLKRTLKSSLRRKIIQTRGQMCYFCRYDLSSRERDDHLCPECGQIVPRRECVRVWCRFLRSRI